jgi:hypothetical protein
MTHGTKLEAGNVDRTTTEVPKVDDDLLTMAEVAVIVRARLPPRGQGGARVRHSKGAPSALRAGARLPSGEARRRHA